MLIMTWDFHFWFLFLSFSIVILTSVCYSQELLQSVEGVVGAENYTYYRLSRHGRLRIELESVYGDADLYISDETLNPKFDDFTQYSATCGKEELEIPDHYKRPVGIGIYGYPSQEISKFIVSIIALKKSDDVDYDSYIKHYYNYEALAYAAGYSDKVPSPESVTASYSDNVRKLEEEEDEEGSVFWQILLTLLKVLFEAIID